MRPHKRRKEGKIVDTIRARVNGVLCLMELRVAKTRHGSFYYRVENDDPPFEVHDDDPKVCEKLAREKLNELLAIEWKPHLLVRVVVGDGGGSWDEKQARLTADHLSLEVTRIDIAKQEDGKPVWRYGAKDHNDRQSTYDSDPAKEHRWDENDAVSLLADTPLNRERLSYISQGLATLSNRLLELLSSKSIQKTLENVRTLALPAPAEVKLKGRRKR